MRGECREAVQAELKKTTDNRRQTSDNKRGDRSGDTLGLREKNLRAFEQLLTPVDTRLGGSEEPEVGPEARISVRGALAPWPDTDYEKRVETST